MSPRSLAHSSSPLLPGANLVALQRIVASDRGGRGASLLCSPSLWERALALCSDADDVAIVTGFFIPSAGAPETDGPLGAVILGRALELLGKRVSLVTDERNFPALLACSKSVDGPSALCLAEPDFSSVANTDLLVFLERPGKAKDGRHYNMRGEDISSDIVPLDDLAFVALGAGIPVLGIGDGGNEAGMGALYEPLSELLPDYAPFLSLVPATVCLPVDVSNWGGYALSALLSVRSGRWLGLRDGEEERMLSALREEGAVDGVLGVAGLSVDGFSLGDLTSVASQIRGWYEEQGSFSPESASC